jgi:hypothetical protein
MKLDISNDSFDSSNDYTRVLLQQGRPILDRDWNEHSAILLHQLRSATRAIYGQHGGPSGGECGFLPYSDGKRGELRLARGSYTIDGFVLECDENYPYTKQKYCSRAHLAPGAAYLIFLEAIERGVTATENAALLDSAMPGVDMAARGQIVWRACHCDWTKILEGLPPELYLKAARERVRRWLLEKCNDQKAPSVEFPEIAEWKTSVVRHPNQLLRFECHSITQEKSTWKFSTDNAFALFRIQHIVPSYPTTDVTISPGSIGGWLPVPRGVAELLTEEQIRFNDPGSLADVKEIRTEDADARNFSIVTLDGVIGGEKDAFRFLRVWNKKVEVAQNILPSDETQIRPGDYWQIAAREEDADPVGTRTRLKRVPRHYAPLALIDWEGTDGQQLRVRDRFQRVVAVPWREVDEEIELRDLTSSR